MQRQNVPRQPQVPQDALRRLRQLLTVVHPQSRGQVIAKLRTKISSQMRHHFRAHRLLHVLHRGILGDEQPAAGISEDEDNTVDNMANFILDTLFDVTRPTQQRMASPSDHGAQTDLLPQPNSPQITSQEVRGGQENMRRILQMTAHIPVPLPDNSFRYGPLDEREAIAELGELTLLTIDVMNFFESGGELFSEDADEVEEDDAMTGNAAGQDAPLLPDHAPRRATHGRKASAAGTSTAAVKHEGGNANNSCTTFGGRYAGIQSPTRRQRRRGRGTPPSRNSSCSTC